MGLSCGVDPRVLWSESYFASVYVVAHFGSLPSVLPMVFSSFASGTPANGGPGGSRLRLERMFGGFEMEDVSVVGLRVECVLEGHWGCCCASLMFYAFSCFSSALGGFVV